ncbi:MAG TPA: hypothetical protein PLV93_01940 [Microthrixaceae bacterium]|nr:hypothetical protein [Microthrixaceae bacterium]
MHMRSGSATADVALQGGRLSSLVVGDLELLVTSGEKPTRWGSFPMVPWCGRLRDARLTFDGRCYEFPPTSPPHANHGFGHLQLWSEVESGERSVTIRTELGGAGTPGEAWPFGGHVEQRFELFDDRLVVAVEVHAGETPMPAMAGWHPWFRRELRRGAPAELSRIGGSVYAVGDDGIPTGDLVPVPAGPWDACFVDIGSDPVVRWPGALELTVSSTFDHWVIYTMPDHALCVEPESGAPNEPNRSPRVIVPGEPLVGSMTLAWRSDEG